MKHKNYLAAVNAFAYGNQLRPKMPIFYVRLAEAHLKLNHFYEAVQNATKVNRFECECFIFFIPKKQ